MKLHRLHRKQFVPRPLEEVFPFFERPENLEWLTPALLKFRILTPSPVPMHVGSLIDYTIRVHGVPVHWRTLVTENNPPHRFVDQSLKGPYAIWHHAHDFRTVEGGTEIEDTVDYALPLGLLGELAHAWFVRRDLEAIFDFRARAVAQEFGGSGEPSD